MSDKQTSSKPIKVFAIIIFIIGIIFTILVTAAIVIAGLGYASNNAASHNETGIKIATIIGAIIFFLASILLLMVEKAMLMSYAEIAEDMREVRNILSRRDNKV